MNRILRPGVNCMGIYGVRMSGLMVDGHDYYRAFFEAANGAQRYILLAGWQFDSEARLLRGKAAEHAGDVRLLPFLNRLCEKNPELSVYILAWDFAEIYLIDREWFQEWVFNWSTNQRVHFRFDNRHAVAASHHEKYAVVDGIVAFVGGMDICANRWDDRDHLADNPDRKNPQGELYEPYHDAQSCHIGPVAEALTDLFKTRWQNSGGGMLDLPIQDGDFPGEIRPTLPIHADEAAISRTRAKGVLAPQESIQEIRNLYIDALSAAERLIYIENQYVSSGAVHRALTDRLRAKNRPKLQIVLILPRRQHAITEAIALGLAQAKMLKSLGEIASMEGHSIGIYYCLAEPRDKDVAVYIHSKLLVVDDRFMTLGSANTTNRSMGLDTELNVSWEAYSEKHEGLTRSIRTARISLLREHAGLGDNEGIDVETVSGLVQRLDKLVDSGKCRLRRHTMETIIDRDILPEEFKPEDLMLDPERPVVEENIFELISHDKTGLFSEGITLLRDALIREKKGVLRRLLGIMWKRPLTVVLLLALLLWLVLRWLGR
ncbi:MAG: phospholipase D-like domain-containing protein [Chloroflexota bacterium]